MIENGKRVIRKYPNRRLYDTEQSVHVTLKDVVDMVKQRVPMVVICHRTQRDITRAVLFDSLGDLEASRPVPRLGVDQIAEMIRHDISRRSTP